ncbi:MAG: hypothetical protein K5986_11130 [Clostridium sp.]|uniref:glycan biosynthesis hexose transferase WsfD n=1 Tax=Clostridium sp. DSM 8431 TaxID=1761781 RepID=UPI0008DEC5E2|nr:hypothetical protein [Clostridium sp. DSM 8431]MCR4944967.1 hypothetical protein [Clostridium sp.]SFU56535.1 hypothetical protein SAMN04487886_105913 [Clostridium sp. DSM 8431]
MNFKENIKKNKGKLSLSLFIILAVSIVVYVIFKSPIQGVADQGDFDRVMSAAGLSLLDSDTANPDFVRFYDYIVTDYKISPNIFTVFTTIAGSSIGYLIGIINIICKLLWSDVFKTEYLAIAYSILYIFGIVLLLKNLKLDSRMKYLFAGISFLFVFFDGNYLMWFNSLYGEPMMISTTILLIAAYLSYINYKYEGEDQGKLLKRIYFVFVCAFLFLGSKMQVLTALPFVIILLGKMLWENKSAFDKKTMRKLMIIFAIVVIYPLEISVTNGNISKDTQYNSVFYGVLYDSDTPEQDLIDMGLNPDMAIEAGKHSYLDEDEYVKYVPRTEITEEEFYSKMGNSKLAKFYLTHPLRLIKGMEYSASKAFITSTSLGKTSRDYSEESITELSRFTTWSEFRENNLPANLWFIVGVYLVMFLFSLWKLIKNKEDKKLVSKIILMWCVMLIGAVQFPMPLVGNGHADTAKQLYLFNFIFDIMLLICANYIFDKIVNLCKNAFDKKGVRI